jgi:hypothetical protein
MRHPAAFETKIHSRRPEETGFSRGAIVFWSRRNRPREEAWHRRVRLAVPPFTPGKMPLTDDRKAPIVRDANLAIRLEPFPHQDVGENMIQPNLARLCLALIIPCALLRTEASADERILERADACREEAALASTRGDQIAAYAKFFADASPEELRALTNHEDASIALIARWSLRQSDLPAARLMSHPQRWLGFLEGRTGLAAPDAWAARLSCEPGVFQSHAAAIYKPAGLVGTHTFTVDGRKVVLPYVRLRAPLHRTAAGIFCKQGCDISVTDGTVRFSTATKSLELPERVLKPLWIRNPDRKQFCAFQLEHERLYAAFYDSDGHNFPLICYDATRRELLWTAEIWALEDCQPLQFSGYREDQRVDLVIGPRGVACFGTQGSCCYVDAFDLKTGNSIFQFRNDSPASKSRTR